MVGWQRDISQTDENNISVFFLGVLCLVHLNDSEPSFPFRSQHIQLVITSWGQDVSSCCHLKTAAESVDCDEKAENVSEGSPTGCHRDPNLCLPQPRSPLFSAIWRSRATHLGECAQASRCLPFSSHLAAATAKHVWDKPLNFMFDNSQKYSARRNNAFWSICHGLQNNMSLVQNIFSADDIANR